MRTRKDPAPPSIASLLAYQFLGVAMIAVVVMALFWLSLGNALSVVSAIKRVDDNSSRVYALHHFALRRQQAVARLYAAKESAAARVAYAAETEDIDKRQSGVMAKIEPPVVRSGIEFQQKRYCAALDALADAYPGEESAGLTAARLLDAPEWEEYNEYMGRLYFRQAKLIRLEGLDQMDEAERETLYDMTLATAKLLCLPLAIMFVAVVVSIWSVRKRLRVVRDALDGERSRLQTLRDVHGVATEEEAEEALRTLEEAAKELDSLIPRKGGKSVTFPGG